MDEDDDELPIYDVEEISLEEAVAIIANTLNDEQPYSVINT